MGLDMSVIEVSDWNLQQFSDCLSFYLNKYTEKTYNVHTAETEVKEFDLGDFINENPTMQIPSCLGEEVCYWRKHPNLHGWMEQLWRSKGGEGTFYGPVMLTESDVLNLKEAVEKETLPETFGFFFGSSDGREKKVDLECIEKMLQAIRRNSLIYYTSSW